MTKNILVAGFLAIGMLPLAARADLITGELNFTGSAEISLDNVQFGNNILTAGSFNIDAAILQQGGFMALGGTTGAIKNITDPPYAPGVIFLTPDFMTFAAAPNISIALIEVLPGIGSAADCTIAPVAGQTCTPATSGVNEFNFENTSATSSTAAFGIVGVEIDSLTNTTTPITGSFSFVFPNANFQQLLAVISGEGDITSTYAGEITVPPASGTAVTPEPASLIEVLTGGIGGLGLYVRRTGKRAKN